MNGEAMEIQELMGLLWEFRGRLECLNRFPGKSLDLLYLNVLIDTLYDWGTFPLSSIIKQETCKSSLQPKLIGHNKWEPIRLPKPTQVVNLKSTGCLAEKRS